MTAQSTLQTPTVKDRHVLIALDESRVAEKAVLYVGDFLGGSPGFRVTLLTIIPKPSEDYFKTDKEERDWIKKHRAHSLDILNRYKEILVQSGFREDKVAVRVDVRKCPSLAKCILQEQKVLGCCTVVLGRRKISKKEEFIFGSTSSAFLHSDKNCAVWVVE